MALSIFRRAPQFWERRGPTSLLLWPLAYLYGCILRIRKLFFDLDITRPKPAPVPIIIVGNIRVGGTGKTPIVIAITERRAILGRGSRHLVHDEKAARARLVARNHIGISGNMLAQMPRESPGIGVVAATCAAGDQHDHLFAPIEGLRVLRHRRKGNQRQSNAAQHSREQSPVHPGSISDSRRP